MSNFVRYIVVAFWATLCLADFDTEMPETNVLSDDAVRESQLEVGRQLSVAGSARRVSRRTARRNGRRLGSPEIGIFGDDIGVEHRSEIESEIPAERELRVSRRTARRNSF